MVHKILMLNSQEAMANKILMPNNRINMVDINQEWTLIISLIDHMAITDLMDTIIMDNTDIMVLMVMKKKVDMVQHKVMYQKEELNQDMDHNLVMINKVMDNHHNLAMDNHLNKDMDNNYHNLGMDNNLHNNIQEVIKVIGKYYINY